MTGSNEYQCAINFATWLIFGCLASLLPTQLRQVSFGGKGLRWNISIEWLKVDGLTLDQVERFFLFSYYPAGFRFPNFCTCCAGIITNAWWLDLHLIYVYQFQSFFILRFYCYSSSWCIAFRINWDIDNHVIVERLEVNDPFPLLNSENRDIRNTDYIFWRKSIILNGHRNILPLKRPSKYIMKFL